MIRTLLLALQLIYTCLPFISPLSEGAALPLLTEAVTRHLPQLLEILLQAAVTPPSVCSQQPVDKGFLAAAQPVRQGSSGSRGGNRGRGQGRRGAAAVGSQSAANQEGGQQAHKVMGEVEQLAYIADLRGLVHACCSAIHRGCHVALEAGHPFQSKSFVKSHLHHIWVTSGHHCK
jgi:hypothetical protein